MGVEFLVRLTDESNRKAKTIISQKPYPGVGYGAEEGPPRFGRVRVTTRDISDFARANRNWSRDSEIIETPVSATVSDFEITESTPTTKVALRPATDLAELNALGSASNITVDAGTISFRFTANDENSMEQFRIRLHDMWQELLERRLFMVTDTIFGQLQAAPGNILEVSDMDVVNYSNDQEVSTTE